ncbi:MAG: LacI family DNA-binding transcriptional regulator [Pirellulales bacterium]|nr:LacI family DNA-binding transcriptional regulator [Pirellulales bacterium]
MTSQRRRVTLKDVAREAEVAVTTAGKVLANRATEFRISQRTAQRVREIARKLGYVPSHAARSLRSSKSGIIAVFLADATDPITAGILHSILTNLPIHHYFPIVTVEQTGVQEAQATWRKNRVEGVIFCGNNPQVRPSLLAGLKRDGIVSLVAGNYHLPAEPKSFARVAIVRVDDRAGIELAIHHMAEQHRRRIGYIPGPATSFDAIERQKSYEQLIRKHHAPIVAGNLGNERYWNRGYLGAMQLLKKRGPRVDAVMAYDDPVAMGAIKYLSDNHIRVPEDVAVVGFDNQPEAEYSIPPLTSIHQPVDEIGRKTVELMKRMLEKQAKPEHLLVNPQLMARGSTIGAY